jgi:hypothetical protein
VHGVILIQEFEKHFISLEAASEIVDNSEVGTLVFYIKSYAAKMDAKRRLEVSSTTCGNKGRNFLGQNQPTVVGDLHTRQVS